MGLSSATTIGDGLQLCVFDLRRGQHEGQELDKILFFFPYDCPYSTQLSVIGLSEGLITFTRIFSPYAACEVIEAEKHSHVFYQAEPDIWVVMVVEKSKELEASRRTAALQAVLKEVHSLFVMFHGSVRALLEKQPGGGLARSHLHSFVSDYLTDFLVGKKLQLPSFRDCLRERGTVQMLTIGREAAIEVQVGHIGLWELLIQQSLVRVLESSCAGNGNAPCSSLILFQDLLVSTTLPPDDTTSLFTYAVLRLTPRVLSSGTTWSYLRKGAPPSHVAAASILASSGISPEELQYTSRDTSPGRQGLGYQVPRPLQRERWSKGKDGFVATDIWGGEVGNVTSAIPTVWLQQKGERMYLLVYQLKNLTVIVLIPVSSLIGEQGMSLVKQQLLENASLKILKVEERLSRGWGGENAYHVSGYRYLLIDNDRNVSRASPPGKVTTLTKPPARKPSIMSMFLQPSFRCWLLKGLGCFSRGIFIDLLPLNEDSLLALSKLRQEVDLEKSQARRDDPEHEKDLEVCIRARNNAWIIARITRGKELYMVLEKARETLLYASDAVEKFSNRYCDGAFPVD